MTTPDPCSCDDSKHWQLRALRAEAKARALELALKFARQQLERLLGGIGQVIGAPGIDDGEPIVSHEGELGRTLGSPGSGG